MSSWASGRFVDFLGDAEIFYDNINDAENLAGLWEELFFIVENGEVDDERVFDYPTEDGSVRIIYGPPFTIVFEIQSNGRLEVYTIRRPSF